MKLYNSIGPNPQTVRMFAAEKGIKLELVALDPAVGDYRKPPYSDINPMMQFPTLITDEGQAIAEILPICEYLEELTPTPALVGSTPGERAETRMWCRRIDLNILESRSRAGRATTFREYYQDKIKLLSVSAAEELKVLVEDRIRWLDQQIAGKAYICGERYTLADIMFYCFMAFRPPGVESIPKGCANLEAWFARIDARPSAKA